MPSTRRRAMIPACTLCLFLWASAVILGCVLGNQDNCDPPARLYFAELADKYKDMKSFPFGTTVNYVCRPGYTKHRALKSSMTCLENQKWSQVQEFCKKKSCGLPKEPENGQLIVPEDLLLGSSVNYICDEGYRRIGDSSRQCVVSNGKVVWTGAVAYCQIIPCFPPPNIPHGRRTGMHIDDFYYGISVTYTCDKDYPLLGNPSIHCTTKDGLNGVWSGRVYCGVAECPQPVVENGSIVVGRSDTYTSNHKVTFDCSAGHIIVGLREIHCQVDGTWDPPPPHCKPVSQCPSPPDIANGKHNGVAEKKFTSLMSVTYVCDPGYQLVGKASISCTDFGDWSHPVPHCEVVQCQAPLYIRNGTHSNMETKVFTNGMTVKYTCDPGSVLIGEATIICTANGTWSSSAPRCKVPQCHTPPYVQNATYHFHESSAFSDGIFVNYTCEPGYTLIGEATLYCTTSGTWNLPAPRCEIGTCGPPFRLNFAELSNENKEKNSFPVGATVNYVCRPGYTKHPGLKASVMCLTSQKWTKAQEFCKRRSCGNPGEPENGRLIVPNDILLGSTVHYICDEGHKQIGQSSRKCVVSGRRVEWTGEVPLCERISCSPPPDVPHGKHTGKYREDFSYATSVTYACEKGYPLVGNASIHCTTKDGINGVWSGHVYCGVTECPHPVVENGRIVAGRSNTYTSNHRVTFGCSAGHVIAGSEVISCQVDGTWDPPLPRCVSVLQCPSPPSLPNGNLIGQHLTSYPLGTYVRYTCNYGYLLRGIATSHCKASGTWSQPLPQCEVMRCPAPPTIAHGTYFGKNFTVGNSVFYFCDAGYSVVGEHMVTCILGGPSSANWSDPPKCKGCSAPPEIAHGKPETEILQDFAYGSSVTYHCDTGYVLTGEATIHCLSSGLWSQPAPQCKVTDCVRPEIQNGRTSGFQVLFKPMEKITFECDPGYMLKGNHTTQCQSDGTWNPSVPICAKVLQCLPPPSLPNGNHSSQHLTSYPLGTKVQYTCNYGYLLRGIATSHCKASGTWSQPLPQCEVMHCPAPPMIAHGTYIGKNFTVGNSVFYFCDAGYSVVGQRVVTCILGGPTSANWSDPPKCKGCPAPPKIAHGKSKTEILQDFAYGSSVTYRCDTGYVLIGEATIHCLSSGSWSQPAPQCQVPGCVRPDIQNGRIAGSQALFKPMERISLECNPGYKVKGDQTTWCQFDGTWNPPVPKCAKGEDPIFPGEDSGFPSEDNMDSKIHPSSSNIFKFIPEIFSTLHPSFMAHCPSPPDIDNGHFSDQALTVFPVGTTIRYSCFTGYQLIGKPSISCTESGSWSLPLPYCEVMRCPAPPTIAHGTYTGKNFTVGNSVFYFCDAGYSVVGEHVVTCILGGPSSANWSDPPKCKATGCVRPEIQNGRAAGFQALFKMMEIITLECDPGYILKGNPTSQCQFDGKWNPPIPICARVMRCPVPPRIDHGDYIGNNFTLGDSVFYICDTGYSLIGEHMVTCILGGSSSANWSATPKCKGCPAPPEIAHGKPDTEILQDFAYGSSVTYHCDTGYILTGEATIHCDSSGSWNQPVPRCKSRQLTGCARPEIQNGRAITFQAFFQSMERIMLECDPGYLLKGNNTIQCQSDGKWNPPVPVCAMGYNTAVLGIGSVVGILLLLIISGIIWMLVWKQKKIYTQANVREIQDCSESQL